MRVADVVGCGEHEGRQIRAHTSSASAPAPEQRRRARRTPTRYQRSRSAAGFRIGTSPAVARRAAGCTVKIIVSRQSDFVTSNQNARASDGRVQSTSGRCHSERDVPQVLRGARRPRTASPWRSFAARQACGCRPGRRDEQHQRRAAAGCSSDGCRTPAHRGRRRPLSRGSEGRRSHQRIAASTRPISARCSV